MSDAKGAEAQAPGKTDTADAKAKMQKRGDLKWSAHWGGNRKQQYRHMQNIPDSWPVTAVTLVKKTGSMVEQIKSGEEHVAEIRVWTSEGAQAAAAVVAELCGSGSYFPSFDDGEGRYHFAISMAQYEAARS